jgi:hypothetical protein
MTNDKWGFAKEIALEEETNSPMGRVEPGTIGDIQPLNGLTEIGLRGLDL